ncbi:hypothetical protein BsWGS_15968 [Bradybaena similaris]
MVMYYDGNSKSDCVTC